MLNDGMTFAMMTPMFALSVEKHDDDEYEDSGWRIRGTSEAIADDEQRGEGPMYIAIGKVLNADDRWLPLIDREHGTAFQWDADVQDYVELD